jgi:hypothetical protein
MHPSCPVRLDSNRNCPPFIYPILSASLSKISGEKINTKAPATRSPSATRPAAETEQVQQVCSFASTKWLMRKYTTVSSQIHRWVGYKLVFLSYTIGTFFEPI